MLLIENTKHLRRDNHLVLKYISSSHSIEHFFGVTHLDQSAIYPLTNQTSNIAPRVSHGWWSTCPSSTGAPSISCPWKNTCTTCWSCWSTNSTGVPTTSNSCQMHQTLHHVLVNNQHVYCLVRHLHSATAKTWNIATQVGHRSSPPDISDLCITHLLSIFIGSQ